MDARDGRQNSGCFFLDSLSPRAGTILAAILADVLADGLNSDQIAALGGFITIIGDALGYISAQMELNDSK